MVSMVKKGTVTSLQNSKMNKPFESYQGKGPMPGWIGSQKGRWNISNSAPLKLKVNSS